MVSLAAVWIDDFRSRSIVAFYEDKTVILILPKIEFNSLKVDEWVISDLSVLWHKFWRMSFSSGFQVLKLNGGFWPLGFQVMGSGAAFCAGGLLYLDRFQGLKCEAVKKGLSIISIQARVKFIDEDKYVYILNNKIISKMFSCRLGIPDSCGPVKVNEIPEISRQLKNDEIWSDLAPLPYPAYWAQAEKKMSFERFSTIMAPCNFESPAESEPIDLTALAHLILSRPSLIELYWDLRACAVILKNDRLNRGFDFFFKQRQNQYFE